VVRVQPSTSCLALLGLVEVPHARFLVPEERPDVVADTVTRFLAAERAHQDPRAVRLRRPES